MRMISRREAVDIVRAHGLGPAECAVSHSKAEIDLVERNAMAAMFSCESFNDALGVHDQYAIIDVKNWLGY